MIKTYIIVLHRFYRLLRFLQVENAHYFRFIYHILLLFLLLGWGCQLLKTWGRHGQIDEFCLSLLLTKLLAQFCNLFADEFYTVFAHFPPGALLGRILFLDLNLGRISTFQGDLARAVGPWRDVARRGHLGKHVSAWDLWALNLLILEKCQILELWFVVPLLLLDSGHRGTVHDPWKHLFLPLKFVKLRQFDKIVRLWQKSTFQRLRNIVKLRWVLFEHFYLLRHLNHAHSYFGLVSLIWRVNCFLRCLDYRLGVSLNVRLF